MREINLIVIHCSATREDRCFTEYDLEECHRRRGFDGAGYHFYIRKNGKIVTTRPVERIGAHAKGFNAHSIGICYEGGLSSGGVPTDTRTLEQKAAMLALLRELRELFPTSLIVGHHDLNPMKPCPCFNVVKEMAGI